MKKMSDRTKKVLDIIGRFLATSIIAACLLMIVSLNQKVDNLERSRIKLEIRQDKSADLQDDINKSLSSYIDSTVDFSSVHTSITAEILMTVVGAQNKSDLLYNLGISSQADLYKLVDELKK